MKDLHLPSPKTMHHHPQQNSHKHHKGHQNTSHHDHHAHMITDFKQRFWICLLLSLPILLLSPMIQNWLNLNWSFNGDRYILFALSSILFFYGGFPFLKGLKDEISQKKPGMMTLIGVAISAAYFYSSAVVFFLIGKTFFWELATLIDVMLLGHWIEMKSVMRAGEALKALVALMPNEANLIHQDHLMKVPVKTLKKDDLILIKPGEKIPADGIIIKGKSAVNESMLTGESKPVNKTVGETVIGGAVNGNGTLTLRIQHIGENSYLNKVIKMVEDAQKRKSNTQKLADKAAFWLTIIALSSGIITFGVWLLLGQTLAFALERMVTVMVICCPHALGLAVPLVAAISTSHAAKNGLLIRNRTAFENSRKISTIVFDKTGTLTKGNHEVKRIISLNKHSTAATILQLAASVEQQSEHHMAAGLLTKAQTDGLDLLTVQQFKYQPGIGVQGQVKEQLIEVGGEQLLFDNTIQLPQDEQATDSETKIYVLKNKELIGYITFADQIRENSFEAINTLKKNGIKCLLLTGDNESVAQSVANTLQLDAYFAKVLPEEKQAKIKLLQQQGEFVAMTGDGVNDAPALAQADVGIAIGSGTAVAAETADIILVNSDPKDITRLILFGKATYRKMVQNLFWATGYNIIALPLATGFIPGLMISPAAGAALMSVSTIICAVNAQLLRYELNH